MRASRKPTAAPKQARKPTLSPTRISAFLDCAVKYRYIYIDKIGRFYMRARAGYSFGSTLHHVLQDFHEQGGAHSPEELAVQLEQNWIPAGYETPEQEQEHRETGREIVTAYHSAHQERSRAQVETFATEKTLTCDMGRFKLSGRVDRIDRHPDGRLEIIDYKSGRWETTVEDVANSLAMSCYQLILRRLYPDTQIFATIYSLRSGIQASYELAGDALAAFERDLLALGDLILDTDYERLRPVVVDACPSCDFLPRCSRYWHVQESHDRPDAPFPEDDPSC